MIANYRIGVEENPQQ